MGIVGVEDRLDGVDRAGADVAEHDAECTDDKGQANRLPVPRARAGEVSSDAVSTVRPRSVVPDFVNLIVGREVSRADV